MTELDQLAAHADAAPVRIFLRHLQDQLLELGIETWPARATPATVGRPLPLYQRAMPTENRLWLDKHPAQSRPIHPPTERSEDRPIRRAQLQPLDLTANHAKLVPEKKDFRLWIVDPQPDVKQVEDQAHQRIDQSQEHGARDPIGQVTLRRVACPPMNM